MTAAYQVKDLMFFRQKKLCLNIERCELPEGKIVAVVGPNGAGKSTLLRLLAGLLSLSQGSIRLFGKGIGEYSSRLRARQISFMGQAIPDDMPFTVHEIVRMGRAPWQNMLGVSSPQDEAAVTTALDMVGVSVLSGSLVSALSGGERQRVFIAKTLCQDTPVMIFDEPTSALDYRQQGIVLRCFADLSQQHGKTIIMAVHDLNLASLYADAILLLNKGALVTFGSPAKVLCPDVLSSVYGETLLYDLHPQTGAPRLTLQRI